MKQTFNPRDECGYSFSRQNQDSGVCGICEFKQLRESTFSAAGMCRCQAKYGKYSGGNVDESRTDRC